MQIKFYVNLVDRDGNVIQKELLFKAFNLIFTTQKKRSSMIIEDRDVETVINDLIEVAENSKDEFDISVFDGYFKNDLEKLCHSLYAFHNIFAYYKPFTTELSNRIEYDNDMHVEHNVKNIFCSSLFKMIDILYIDNKDIAEEFYTHHAIIKSILDKYESLIDIRIYLEDLIFLLEYNADNIDCYKRLDGCKISNVANISLLNLSTNKSNFKHSIHDIIDYNIDESLYDNLFYHSKKYFYKDIENIIERRSIYTTNKPHISLPINIILYEQQDYDQLKEEIIVATSMGYDTKIIKLNSSTEIDIIYEIESYIDPCYNSATDNTHFQYL